MNISLVDVLLVLAIILVFLFILFGVMVLFRPRIKLKNVAEKGPVDIDVP